MPTTPAPDPNAALAELLARAADPALLADDEFEALEAELEATAATIADGPLDDEALGQLQAIAAAVDAIRAESAQRQETAASNAATAAELLSRIRGQEEGGDEEDAEVDEPADDDTPAEVEGPDEEETPTTAEVEPVAAGARPAPRIGRVSARRPTGLPRRAPAARAQLPADVGEWGLVAAVDSQTRAAGQPIENIDHVIDAFTAAYDLSLGYRGPRTKFKVVRSGAERAEELYGPDRTLNRDSRANAAKIDAVTAPTAITAAGGRCVSSPVRYDLPVIGDDARPVRNDMMARFGADRAGVKTIPPPTLVDVDGSVGFWTEANDQAPSNPATKPCLTITCPDEDETVVEAVTRCLKAGEFRRRFFPEQVDAWLRLIAVHHAREAEIELLTTIGDGSKAISVGQGLGATRDLVAGLDRALSIFASSHRAANTTWRWGAPFWLLNMIRTDLAREMPGSADERLAMADAAILAIFRAHGVTPTFFLDGESGQIFNVQGEGALQGWPSTVVTYLYPEGSWLFLDGGSFEAGWYRDSSLIETNDAKFFGETFEGAHFHGTDSWRVTFDLCPDGTASGTVDFDPCAGGS